MCACVCRHVCERDGEAQTKAQRILVPPEQTGPYPLCSQSKAQHGVDTRLLGDSVPAQGGVPGHLCAGRCRILGMEGRTSEF